jgi:predicted dehydrogenase
MITENLINHIKNQFQISWTGIHGPSHWARVYDIGMPMHFRGFHCEDYLADKDSPFSWRLDASLAGQCGALGDLGWHILSIARYLCGSITELCGAVRTFYPQRKSNTDSSTYGPYREVENEDWAGLTVHFESGASGTIEASRVAHGRKMDIGFELVCEHGTIAFHGERSNEIKLFVHGDKASEAGFKTIHINSEHPDYGAFLPAPGHGIGFNDLKTIELHQFLEAIAKGCNVAPDMGEACKIARVCEAVIESSNSRIWVKNPKNFTDSI